MGRAAPGGGRGQRVADLNRGLVWRACQGSRTTIPGGWATRLPGAPLVHHVNTVRLRERPDDDELSAVAERHQSGLGYRRVAIERDDAGEPDGWARERVVVMARNDDRPLGAGAGAGAGRHGARAREVDEPALARLERRIYADQGADCELARQLSVAQAAIRAGTECRRFVAGDEPRPAAMATLFIDRALGVALVESVGTLRMWRDQGLGTAVMRAALQAARQQRVAVVGVITDAEDWPQLWYASLGFAPECRHVAYVRRAHRSGGGAVQIRPPVSSLSAASPGAAVSRLPGPFGVGAYAAQLRRRLRDFAHVQLTGEVWGLRVTRARIYFELRDAAGALPCAMWREEYERLGLALSDGTAVVAGGGCDYYMGSSTSSPSFSFSVTELRVAGEGDLLAQLQRLRRRLHAEGLFEPQKSLARPALPRCIGVVCAETGKARDDVLAGLRRRGWGGRLVWAFAPVQDRRAAPRITASLRELAATPQVELVIVARGGGSLADLFAFCDETLCRTVALLRVPVIASVGHHTDRTLLDDVAAVSCSTPTHAAEAAVAVDLTAARAALHGAAARLRDHGRRAVATRARELARLTLVSGGVVARHRARLHQLLRELRAAGRRSAGARAARLSSQTAALERAARRGAGADSASRRRELERFALALSAHDPQRTLARGYALVTDAGGGALGSAADARAAGAVRLRFHDDTLPATVDPESAGPQGDDR